MTKNISIEKSDTELIIKIDNVSFKMIRIESGTFEMGTSQDSEDRPNRNEFPQHKVIISKDFYLAETLVTQRLWYIIMRNNPSSFKTECIFNVLSEFCTHGNNPVECVLWDNCLNFIDNLNSVTGLKFRLPTEAEWEYAARGGRYSKNYKYSGSNDIEEVAWSAKSSWPEIGSTHPVGQKKANELGLYDMSGNVWEWCNDWYDERYYYHSPIEDPQGPIIGDFRVYRGGCWDSSEWACRVSTRGRLYPGIRGCIYGFRLALTL